MKRLDLWATRPRPRRAARLLPLAAIGSAVACGGDGDGHIHGRLELLEPAVFSVEASADPSLAVDPVTGALLLAWAAETDGVWNLYFSRSADGGRSFAPPSRVNDRLGAVHPHAEGAPRLVAAPGVVALFWNDQFDVPGRAFGGGDLLFARSVDGGREWSPAVAVQDDPGGMPPRANTFHGAAWIGDSTLVVAWLDGRDRDERRIDRAIRMGVPLEEALADPERYSEGEDIFDGDASLYAAFSHDLGASWEPENRRIQENLCPCCRVSLVRGPEGEAWGAWRQHFEGDVRDPAFRRIEPDGTTSPSRPIHADGWVYPGCPHSGPALDLTAEGAVHAAWYTGAEGRMGVHYAVKPAGSLEFGTPTPIATGTAIPIAHPAVAALPSGGAVVAHNVNAAGDRVIAFSILSPGGSLERTLEVPGSEGGTHPQLARLADGSVVAAWTASHGGVQRVRMARLVIPPDAGSTSQGPEGKGR